MAVKPGASQSEERVRWWSPTTLVVLGLVVGIIVTSLIGLAHADTDADKWASGLTLVIGLLAAFSLVGNLLGVRRNKARAAHPTRWWHTAVAVGGIFAVIGVRALTSGESVLAAAGYASAYIGILLLGAVVARYYERRRRGETRRSD